MKYLGPTVLEGGGMEAELKHRYEEGARMMEGLVTSWRNREMVTDMKIELLESLVVPTALSRVLKARERERERVGWSRYLL